MKKLLALFIVTNMLLSGCTASSKDEQLSNNIAISSTQSEESASSPVSASLSEASSTEQSIEEQVSDNAYSDEPVSVLPITFEAVEVGDSSYSHPNYIEGYRPPAVQWQYVRGKEHLEMLSEKYSFQFPSNINLEEHSYIISFGCKIVECWTEEKNGDDYILSVTYAEDYQGKQAFFYQLPKIRIYPFRWPSYILKNDERVSFATNPDNGDIVLLEGYQ